VDLGDQSLAMGFGRIGSGGLCQGRTQVGARAPLRSNIFDL